MTSQKSNKKEISDSSLSEINTTDETIDQNESKSFDSETDFELHFLEGDKFQFEINISEQSVFEVRRILSGKKIRNKVKQGWAALLNEKIWEKFKSDCSWSFKRADVVSNEVIAIGKCSFKACNATIRVQTSNDLTIIKVNIDNFDGNIVHEGNKRRIAGSQKVNINSMLKNSSASKVHNRLVKKIMKPGDIEPAHVPSKNALRILKSRSRLKDRHKDPYQSLSFMAEHEFKKTIHYIGFNPFSVIYSTPLQRKWYRSQITDNRKIISIDATGLKVIPPIGSRISDKKTAKTGGQPKYQTLFLYVIILRGIVSVPVGVMLSQEHTMRFLIFWLSAWSFNNPIPHEINLDQSAALFGACVRTFTNYKSTNAYISACMDSLLNDTQAPPIYLRIDRYHFVCTIHRIKQFKKMDSLKVSLLKAIFGVLILCDDLSAVKKIITDLFTLIRNRFITNACKKSLIDLQAVCETHEIFIEEEEEKEVESNEDIDSRGENMIEQCENDSYKETSTYRLYFQYVFFLNK